MTKKSDDYKKAQQEWDNEISKFLKASRGNEIEEAKKQGYYLTAHPNGWLPKDTNIMLRDMDAMELIYFKGKNRLVLRYHYLIDKKDGKSKFTPVYINDGGNIYRIENKKFISVE
jgi:hypothetical protein